MAGDSYSVSVESTTTLTNYKPSYGRKATGEDIANISSYNKLNVDVSKASLFNELKALDGNPETLAWSDAELAKASLQGKYDIKKVGIDPNAKVLSFTFKDGTYIRLDMQENAVNNIKNDIHNGNAIYENWYNLDNILASFSSKDGFKDEILIKVPEGTTMKAIKEKYNLPDGALTSYVTYLKHATGNRDNYTVGDDCKAWFSARAFAENNGLTMDELKAMFQK